MLQSTKRIGYIVKINGNMVSVQTSEEIIQNEVAYIIFANERLKSEVILIKADTAEMEVYESTVGLKVGTEVEFSGELLSAELGPGLLGQIFDGLENPLPAIAKECGFFLKRGIYLEALTADNAWEFIPLVKPGDRVRAGQRLGFVIEKIFKHYIMAPFSSR